MKSIVIAPDPVLSQIARPVQKFDASLQNLIEEMKITLSATKDPEGVGLAAPQIGESLQIFIMKPTKKSKVTVVINPLILSTHSTPKTPSESDQRKLEGCLSLPTIWGEVTRFDTITLSYQNEAGVQKKETFTGFMATIVQHECDHLQGILFPKKVLEQDGTLYKSHKENGKDVFNEINL